MEGRFGFDKCLGAFADFRSIALSHDFSVPLVWVTGISGSGKSSVCEILSSQGHVAVDADWEGLSRWVHRVTGKALSDPPYPVPEGWLDEFAWRVKPEAVERLAASLGSRVCFLCGDFENKAEVRQFFDRVVCLVVDEATLRDRLARRTTNLFGRHPEELRAVLSWRPVVEDQFRKCGAAIVDATQPLDEVAAQVAAEGRPTSLR